MSDRREAPSLRSALLRVLAAPLALALLMGSWLAYLVAGDVVRVAYDQSLVNLAEGVANRVRVEGGELRVELPPEAEAVLRTDRIDRIYFRVRDEAGADVAGDADLPGTERSRPGDLPHFYDEQFRGEWIRGVRLHPVRGGTPFYVTVAETTGKRERAVRDLLLGFFTALLLVVGAVATVVHFGIPAALAPLLRVQREISGRAGTDLAPLDTAAVPPEIRPLVEMLNVQLERLRAANRAQRQFLQDAAHQLRTPLAGLQLELELLESGQGGPEALPRLRRSVIRVTRLANQLLALARAEAGGRLAGLASPGEAPPHPGGRPVALIAEAPRVDLAGLIDEMLDDWLAAADGKRIDFGVEREHAGLAGDPTLLRELLANLVDNALKYTPPGGQVTLSCTHDEETVHIQVSDSGPGIPEAERERVFERFHRLPGSGATGSGLGLSIAREIVRAHGGTIAIDAPPDGRGTRVSVSLPDRHPSA